MATDREQKLLNLAKKMFRDFTGTTLDYAKELIQLEEEVNASSPDIPKAEDEKVNVSQPNPPVPGPKINKAPEPPKKPIKDDDDDLPF